ncbi:MAG: acyltransferase family protein [Deltaproteobacteria bacterium]|nr:acyltransferase family protein [Deltaproteobacteria bacterium]
MNKAHSSGRHGIARLLLPDYVDEPQLDLRVVRWIHPVVERLLSAYFRLEVEGFDNVPSGSAILVCNHNSGISFTEPFAISARWYRERGTDDRIYCMVHDAMMMLPGLRRLLVGFGCVRASRDTCERVLQRGEKVLAFPGGNIEAFRKWSRRNKIDFAGHKGFVRLALKYGVPIIPVVAVGGHETFVVLHEGRALARALRLPQILRSDMCPVFLGLPWGIGFGPVFHFPLPAKQRVRVLDPIPVDAHKPEDADNPAVVDALYNRVVSSMQTTMDEMAAERRWPVLG